MNNKNLSFDQSRRQFLSSLLPLCSISCFSLDGFQEKVIKHKFQKEWGHTYEEAFKWRYGYYIEIMKEFSKYLGREKLIEMIMRAVDDSNPISKNSDPNFSFLEWTEGGSIFQNMMTREIIE